MNHMKAFSRRRLGDWACATIGATALLGCGPNPHEVYLQAMQAQTAAEKGACKLVWDEKAQAHIINSTKLEVCVHEMEKALALYQQARSVGATGRDIEGALLKIEDDIAKLRSMMRNVAAIEQEARPGLFTP